MYKLLAVDDERWIRMGIGDLRLPFALAIDSRDRGLFAFANYNIGTARTLLRILELGED